MSVAGSEAKPRRRWMLLGLLLLAGLSAVGFRRLHVDSSLEPFLPEKSEARQTILFLRDSSFASKVVLWFRLRGDAPVSELFAAADDAEKHLDPALIKRVIHPPQEADAMSEVLGLLDDAGELLTPEDLAELQTAVESQEIRRHVRECFMKLTRPEGSFMEPIIRKDPLGISMRILTRLHGLTESMGYRVEIKGGRLMHPDGRQLMLPLETSTTATSLASSQALVDSLKKICDSAPPNVEIIPMCAQIHTVENQHLMQADTHRAGMVNGVIFLALFLLVSRDWRVASVFLLPLASIAITIGLCGLVFPNPSIMVIGVAMTMAGSAVDYGIFVYTAVSMGKDRKAEMRRILRPLLISHLTTLGVFLAFVFSSVPAYRQLGWLTSVSLVLSLLAALFLLPQVIRPGGKILLLGRGMPLATWGRWMVSATVIGTICLGLACYEASKTRFDSNISRLDGVSEKVKKGETEFQETWGRTNTEQGLLVVSAPSREQAEEANDRINHRLSGRFKEGQFVSLSTFWPSAATRRANLERWNAFWSKNRIDSVRAQLSDAGAKYGFAADGFDPFLQIISQPPRADQSGQILSALQEQFFARSGDSYQMLNYFEDTAENVGAIRALVRDHPEATVVSRRALGQAFAESAISETRLLLTLSAAFIIVFLLALTRDVVKSFLIMLPAIVGLIAMLAVLAMLSMLMNVVTVVAAILVLALASDYGVFAVYAWENREPLLGQGMASIHLCALTTAVGTGALIFAKHPALHLVGVSLTTGLVAGYVTGCLVIPGLCYLRDRWKSRGNGTAIPTATIAGIALLLCLVGGCAPEPFVRAPLPILNNPNPAEIRDQFARATPDHFTSTDAVVLKAPFRDDLFVLAVLNVDRKTNTFELQGLSPVGVGLFELGGTADAVTIRSAVPPLMEHQDILRAMGQDILRMYCGVVPDPVAWADVRTDEVLFSQKTAGGTLVHKFGGEPTVLLEKHLDGFFGPIWRVRYFDYRDTSGKLVPHGLVMDNNQYHYRIIVKNREWSLEAQ